MSGWPMNSPLTTLLLISCILAGADLMADVQITQVRTDKNQFDPNQGETVEVSFVLSEKASASLNIYDGRDWLVESISTSQAVTGEQVLAWDGRSRLGGIVPAEAYRYTISAEDESGQSVTHDLTAATAGADLTATDIRWDAQNKIIEYRIAEPARVNIRVGLKNFGPLMKTVIDWVPRAGGFQQESWDGMDQSSVLDLSDHPNLQIVVDAFGLGANVIFVGNTPDTIQLIPELDASTTRSATGTTPITKRMHFHSQQPMDQRGDVALQLELVGQFPVDASGLPLISGKVPMRMEVASEDRQRVLERRFEPVFFVDGTFTFENEVGFLPFTWIWDTSRANDGIHYITANLRGYEGNFGIATIKVRVDNTTEHSP